MDGGNHVSKKKMAKSKQISSLDLQCPPISKELIFALRFSLSFYQSVATCSWSTLETHICTGRGWEEGRRKRSQRRKEESKRTKSHG